MKTLEGKPDVYEILATDDLTPVTRLFEVHAPAVARKAQAGQFVVVRVHEKGERIPLTIADYDRGRGTITLVVQAVGKTTLQMNRLERGARLVTFAGPLGNPAEIERYGTTLCVGGGSSIAAIYPLARALKEAGNQVLAIIGARNEALIFWEARIRAVSDQLIVCTDDGSYGRRGLVTLPLQELLEAGPAVDHVFAVGPAIMMKACAATTRPFGVPTTVSLNAIMVDGTGMCGGCRVSVGGETRFACVDGPKFDGHQVDWDVLLARQSFYLEEERQATEKWQHECRAIAHNKR
jgi:ferredoxin--NADP+ reductase